ncbi:MAG: DNA-directed RNA polymerase subunit alpha [Patescibacteria group bacterium]
MSDLNIVLPSKPQVLTEDNFRGVYEIEGLYPGYGHTLGNSLRRIILSSLPGYAIVSLKIEGVEHEFSTITGVKEDVINIILNLKKVSFRAVGDEPQTITLKASGVKEVTAGDLSIPGGMEVVNPEQLILTLTDKNAEIDMEMHLEKGLGYLPKEVLQADKVEIGSIALDATFTPIRQVSYEVEQMRVNKRTDFNKLRMIIETNGDITPRQALEDSIRIMIDQLKAVVGFKEEEPEVIPAEIEEEEKIEDLETEDKIKAENEEALKTRIEDLKLSARTEKALSGASIRTVGGLIRKSEEDLLALEGLGDKGIIEIKKALSNFGIVLK